MADRGSHRGGRGGGGGRGDGNNSRGGRGGRGGGHQGNREQGEKPKKENILDLAKYMDKQITVKFNGGREGTYGIRGKIQPPKRKEGLANRWRLCSCRHAQGLRCAYEPGTRRRPGDC